MTWPRVFGPDAHDGLGRKIELELGGHLIDVIVRREDGAGPVPGLPSFYETGALIDTGATDVCIDLSIARDLRLRTVDQRTVGTAGGPILASVHVGVLEVPALGFRKLMPLYAFRVRRTNFSILLGRSFLADYIVTFDGPRGCCLFVRPEEAYQLPPDDE